MASKHCPQGQRWCNVRGKCVPEDEHDEKGQGRRQGKGQGNGPIGQPGGMEKEKVEEATNLVDTILTGDYNSYKVIGRVDTILDEIENQIDTVPDQDIEELQNDVETELTTDSNTRKTEEETQEENTVEENMKMAVKMLVTEEEYRAYFKTMLKKWNINSPSELEAGKKKEFFNAVDKGWKAKKETD